MTHPAAIWAPMRFDVSHLPIIRLQEGATIEGRVVDRRSGGPVAGAVVMPLSVCGNPHHLYLPWIGASTIVARSDEDGRFTLSGVPFVDLSLSVYRRGFARAHVSLTRGNLADSLEVALDVPVEGSGRLAGRLAGISAAMDALNLSAINTVGDRWSTKLDARQYFAFSDLPSGAYEFNLSWMQDGRMRGWNSRTPYRPPNDVIELIIAKPTRGH